VHKRALAASAMGDGRSHTSAPATSVHKRGDERTHTPPDETKTSERADEEENKHKNRMTTRVSVHINHTTVMKALLYYTLDILWELRYTDRREWRRWTQRNRVQRSPQIVRLQRLLHTHGPAKNLNYRAFAVSYTTTWLLNWPYNWNGNLTWATLAGAELKK
jgi:hypothetical protein